VDKEKYIEVVTVNYLKSACQCAAAAAKAMSVIGIIKRNSKSINSNNFMLLYKTSFAHIWSIWSTSMESIYGEGYRVPEESPKKGNETGFWLPEQTVQ